MDEVHSIRIAGIVRESIVDGPGIRFAVFCQGCPHGCKGCHNPETHDFNGGKEIGVDRLLDEIDKDSLLSGVTFSGGEPFCQPAGFLELAKGIKKRNLNIVAYSGYSYEQLLEMGLKNGNVKELLGMIDILIDGPYIEELRDLTLRFRGSSNQRVIDLNKTVEAGRIVLYE